MAFQRSLHTRRASFLRVKWRSKKPRTGVKLHFYDKNGVYGKSITMSGTLIFLVLRPCSENVENRAIHISLVAKIRPTPSEALYRVPKQASKRGFLGERGAWPGPGAEFLVKMSVWPGLRAELLVNVSVWPGPGAEFFVKINVWPGPGAEFLVKMIVWPGQGPDTS